MSIHNMWAIQILKRGIGKTRCKPMRNLAKNSNVAKVLQAPLVPGPHQGAALCRFGKDRSQDPPPGVPDPGYALESPCIWPKTHFFLQICTFWLPLTMYARTLPVLKNNPNYVIFLREWYPAPNEVAYGRFLYFSISLQIMWMIFSPK